MDNPLVVSLIVTGIGMLILFLALALLYGLMILMTVLVKDRPGKRTGAQLGREAEEPTRRQIAAIAAALARAERDLAAGTALETEKTVSAWRALHHHRQLTLNLHTRRSR